MKKGSIPTISNLCLRLIVVTIMGCIDGRSVAQEIPKPRYYDCPRASGQIVIDGFIGGQEWEKAAWSESYVDIEGNLKPAPFFDTRMKMLWDDRYLYIAARMEEPHVWGTLSERESVIFYDNDFEVFIDPDGDNHFYMELEVNALGTEWDLLLNQPYEDNGIANNNWDFRGLKTAVAIQGTINNPADTDTAWTIEIAIPWAAMVQFNRSGKMPLAGDQWRINFSRVEWDVDIVDGRYVKRRDPSGTKPLPERNWVWSAQHVINMHRPETWGYVRFLETLATTKAMAYDPDPDFEAKMWLVSIYRTQHQYFKKHGKYAENTGILKLNSSDPRLKTMMEITSRQFLVYCTAPSGKTWYINQDRKLWAE